VSGVGMHMTKHTFGVYSTAPGPVQPPDQAAVQARLDALPTRPLVELATGPASVAAYTVAHGRDGAPEWGLAVCDLPDGSRCYARVVDPDLLLDVEKREWVGAEVELAPGPEKGNVVSASRTP